MTPTVFRPDGVLRDVPLHEAAHKLRPPARTVDRDVRQVPDPPAELPAAAYERGLADGRRQARDELAGELAQAREAMAAALREEADAARCRSREEGLAEAREAAANELRAAREALLAEARDALAADRDRIGRMAQALAQERVRLLEAAEDDAVALVFDATCRMLATRALEVEHVRALVRELLAGEAAQDRLRARVNPQDCERLRLDAAPAGLEWIADPSVAHAGVVLETADVTLDARLETQLTAFKDVLLRARAQRRLAS